MKLKITANTFLKSSPVQSSDLPTRDKLKLSSGETLDIHSYDLVGKHFHITLPAQYWGWSTGYVFRDHARIEYDINAAIRLIKEFEGCKLQAYLCPSGIPTIGYGTTYKVKMGDTITSKQAEQLLIDDLTIFQRSLNAYLRVPVTDNQYCALLSFVYNVGPGAFMKSTLLTLLNRRDYQGAADQFEKWVNGSDGPLPGLIRRRKAERDLFLS